MPRDCGSQVANLSVGMPTTLKCWPPCETRSWLQPAFVRLHNLLWELGLLPIAEWGYGRGSASFDTSIISRNGFRQFFAMHAPLVRPGSTCLTWDSDKLLAQLLPNCTGRWVLVHDGSDAVRVDRRGRMVHGDLLEIGRRISASHTVQRSSSSSTPHEPALALQGRFDVIACNQVFEHVAQPFEAARALFHMLRRGGIVLWSAPFLERYHKVPTDYFRYTIDGAQRLFLDAGFVVVVARRVGDAATTSGFLNGFGMGDLPQGLNTRLIGGFNQDTWRDPGQNLYISSLLVVRKP